MSRIGKLPVKLPSTVQVSVDSNNIVSVKGPKGTLVQQLDPNISIKIEEGKVVLDRASELKDHRAKHGLYRSLVKNMIVGVSEGYKVTQELIGVGYRAQAKGQQLELSLGYSHSVLLVLPTEIKLTTTSEKGQSPTIVLESHDKQLIGQVAAKIRSLRKPEPYKGKGIRFVGEQVRKKAGKSASKK